VAGDELEQAWAALEREARDVIAAQGLDASRVRRTADLRYRGQAFELEVGAEADPSALVAAFHAAHRDRYGYDQSSSPVELVTLRVRAEGPEPQLPLPLLRGGGDVEDAMLAHREVVGADGPVTARVVDRAQLGAGTRLRGPAVLIGLDATVWIAPWQRCEVDPHGILVLEEAP
jgi:N-methylhydantoinase A